ncbi:hypothetical protein KC357_g166 [Hortaea werneckii]|nr:hypothetical protein KC357_g166 [Hortaea werneckii]
MKCILPSSSPGNPAATLQSQLFQCFAASLRFLSLPESMSHDLRKPLCILHHLTLRSSGEKKRVQRRRRKEWERIRKEPNRRRLPPSTQSRGEDCRSSNPYDHSGRERERRIVAPRADGRRSLWFKGAEKEPSSKPSISSCSSSSEIFSSSTTRLIISFLIPKPTGTSLERPQTRPSFSMLRTDSSSACMSVSSSIKAQVRLVNDQYGRRSDGEDGDHGLGSWLRALGGLLLRVLLQTLLLDPLSLLILFLVVRAEEVDLVVVSGSVRGLGRVGGELVRLRAVGGVLLGRVAWQGGEFGLEGLDVLVPAVGVGVVLRLRGGLDGLEGLDVGLGGGVAGDAGLVSAALHGIIACNVCEEESRKAKHVRGAETALDVVIWRAGGRRLRVLTQLSRTMSRLLSALPPPPIALRKKLSPLGPSFLLLP